MIGEILSLVKKHREWRVNKCINLIPSENMMSPEVSALLSSDFGHRYTSRSGFYMGTRFIDKIEQYGESLAKDIFGSETSDLRPLSGHIADLIFLACFTKPESTVLCVSPDDGGYPGFWKQGLSSLLNLRVVGLPFSREKMNIEVGEATDLILRKRPRVIIFGASLFLFPHPVEELVEVAHRVGSHVGYDGSHVMGLIAGKKFQNPFKEGVHALFGSTHKTLFGPQGGIMLADTEHGEIIKNRIDPEFVDNAHWNRIAALTLALAEMKKFGGKYTEQIIRNAQTLAKTLAEEGFPVACSELGYTKSHQVFLDYGGYKQGKIIAGKLEKANIICDSGVRLGTCEITRRGMKEREMQKIAELMKSVIIDNQDPDRIKEDASKLAKEFNEFEYRFK